MDLKTNTGPVQSDGLAVTTAPVGASLQQTVESSQFFVVKSGNTEMSARFPTLEQANAVYGRLLMEQAAVQNLRVATVDRFGNELLRG